MFSHAQLTREISAKTWPSFWRPRILQFINKDFLKTGTSFYSLTWGVLLFPKPKSSHLQQEVGTTPRMGAASLAALQAGMLRSVLQRRLSQLWAGMGQRSGDRLLVKPPGASPHHVSLQRTLCPAPLPAVSSILLVLREAAALFPLCELAELDPSHTEPHEFI